ncbi:MAG: family 10 glycosylhydrolase, partial [Muribaculaceae bacterium]|nr:family 10 glycosylhydrolase [Muribaculaceae bacterium]
MTPFLNSNWPSSAITASNAQSVKNILVKRLEKFKNQNINVIYYHCRAMCDATYESSYEPWSSTVSGKRGQAPAFDPFGYLVEESHKKGIEVYAWINPYRYCSGSKYGEGELNYENSHPDWLISQTKESILNPGLEEVKQRIVDVISEIVTKYDVDGVIFDDYFYTSGTPMSLDADLYKKYTDGGGKLSQADWRRANINEMVARVNKAIKEIKPWVSFGVGPAGVASPPNVTSEYGLPAAPGGGDWQYSGIYSDPLAWFKQGSIDFMSPQIYWPSRFDALSKWWADAALKYGRHAYPSIDLSAVGTPKVEEVCREIRQTRLVSPADASGLVYFQYATFVNYYEKFDGKSQELGAILGATEYADRALVPLRPWTGSVS